jgi:hypothetical protein
MPTFRYIPFSLPHKTALFWPKFFLPNSSNSHSSCSSTCLLCPLHIFFLHSRLPTHISVLIFHFIFISYFNFQFRCIFPLQFPSQFPSLLSYPLLTNSPCKGPSCFLYFHPISQPIPIPAVSFPGAVYLLTLIMESAGSSETSVSHSRRQESLPTFKDLYVLTQVFLFKSYVQFRFSATS